MTVNQLPPYSGDRPCPKCGYNLVGTTYRRDNYGGNRVVSLMLSSLPPGKTISDYNYPMWSAYPIDVELLERDCKRCGHGWPEATLSPESEGRSIARVAFDKTTRATS